MNKYTPIKRHPAIVSFSRDHHFGLLLVWKIRQGLVKDVSPARISQYIIYCFKEDLEKHFREEENFLFCKLPEDDSMRKEAEADHQTIRNLVAAIVQNNNKVDLLRQFAEELEKHIRFEERSLFNHLQDTLGEKELIEIEQRLSNDNKDVDAKWLDTFWEASKGKSL